MDRNNAVQVVIVVVYTVALRKESVDRNVRIMSVLNGLKPSLSARRAWIEIHGVLLLGVFGLSLSARRAWIEMQVFQRIAKPFRVALRKESVDRNATVNTVISCIMGSLSARRAWIEIDCPGRTHNACEVALRKESVDRNALSLLIYRQKYGSRSPQGERG